MCSLLFLFLWTLAAAYGPSDAECPATNLIREGGSISPAESEWMKSRHTKTDAAIHDFLARVGVKYPELQQSSSNFSAAIESSAADSESSNSIQIAVAFSGGGLRAMLSGAGQLAALDNRTSNADHGLGGILQASLYIAGLSGGAWLLGSLIFQGWPSVEEVVMENPYNVWDYHSLDSFVNTSQATGLAWSFAATNYNKTLTHLSWWNAPQDTGISTDVQEKQAAGFPTSITDAWGRLLAHTLFLRQTEGEKNAALDSRSANFMDSATWSDIRGLTAFENHDMPFPLVTALARRPGSLVYDLNSPIIEFNPFEMGSFDSSINTFTDIKYLGSPVVNGVPSNSCVEGIDNSAFVLGTSSSLFNQFLNTLVCDDCHTLNSVLKFFVKRFLQKMLTNRQDIAWYKPNPFYQSEFAKSENISTSDTLYLMDGGLAGEIVPLSTVAIKERNLDLVFSFDNNGAAWPDGTSLINSYERQFTYEGKLTVIPHVPDQKTFLHHNLTAKPTFFGCDARNLTDLEKDGVTPPIVVYIANRPYEFLSNTSTLKLTYSDSEKKGMVTNGFDVALRGNQTDDWQFCVGCAIVRRSEERMGIQQSEECEQCFLDYCWDGSVYEGEEHAPPNFVLDGLTNDYVPLDTQNEYIQKPAPGLVSVLLSSLGSNLWKYLLSLF